MSSQQVESSITHSHSAANIDLEFRWSCHYVRARHSVEERCYVSDLASPRTCVSFFTPIQHVPAPATSPSTSLFKMTLYYSIVFALLCFEMTMFLVLIVPLPFTWRRKMFHFLATNPIVAKLQYGLKITFM